MNWPPPTALATGAVRIDKAKGEVKLRHGEVALASGI